MGPGAPGVWGWDSALSCEDGQIKGPEWGPRLRFVVLLLGTDPYPPWVTNGALQQPVKRRPSLLSDVAARLEEGNRDTGQTRQPLPPA